MWVEEQEPAVESFVSLIQDDRAREQQFALRRYAITPRQDGIALQVTNESRIRRLESAGDVVGIAQTERRIIVGSTRKG